MFVCVYVSVFILTIMLCHPCHMQEIENWKCELCGPAKLLQCSSW